MEDNCSSSSTSLTSMFIRDTRFPSCYNTNCVMGRETSTETIIDVVVLKYFGRCFRGLGNLYSRELIFRVVASVGLHI